ncbi:CRP-like cAMP-binding protein [Hasllibacter halocynthiae]|uniref:CRP-like cAMP-binding protein n=1 Tax=Hasllibacter halocynthiae TaxID=595589 RepID=A0A2T0X1W5_9RHOB|nr:Crp/Fnr family transcriptional regulator [Hasllibacter halocynthiae]PRY92907.1 CRP-like cAMP-binding protein [Hasllibacter halocynthiae]
MATDCANCPLRGRPLFAALADKDLAFMRRFKVGELTVEAGTPIMMEGSNSPQLFTALRGMGIRAKTLSNGRRQVVNFVYPGDFLGLQSAVMDGMRHTVEAVTRMTLCVFDRKELWSLVRGNPELAYDLTWIAATEEHFLGEALATVGQRTAVERIAWALVRVTRRCEALGIADAGRVPFPFRQQDLADALGLSLVHTNKTLARLRERQLASWHDGILSVPETEKLARVAGMEGEDPAERRPLI